MMTRDMFTRFGPLTYVPAPHFRGEFHYHNPVWKPELLHNDLLLRSHNQHNRSPRDQALHSHKWKKKLSLTTALWQEQKISNEAWDVEFVSVKSNENLSSINTKTLQKLS